MVSFTVKKISTMKNFKLPLLLAAIVAVSLLSIAVSGCLKDKCSATMTYKIWKPVTKSTADIRVEIEAAAAEPLQKTGQIYLFQNWLLVGEREKGIHVFDNTNPDDPKNIAFINLPGCVDMAVRDGILFADNYMDLVAIDIKNPVAPKLVARVEDVFPFNHYNAVIDSFIVGYEETDETVEIDCNSGYYGKQYLYYGEFGCKSCEIVNDATGGGFVASNTGSAPKTGVGGSFARFTIAGERLYSVDNQSLHSFDISNLTAPKAVGQPISVGFGIETLFAMGQKLFIGSNSGMFIFDAGDSPDSPKKLGEFIHARACDPVVADGTTAFVTLHDGTACQGFANQMDVIDINDLTKPVLLKTFDMAHPLGLGVRGNQLFVCDEGVKIFDKTDPATSGDRLLAKISGINATDIIPVPWSKDLIILSPDGIYQYDAADLANLRQRSLIGCVK